MPRRAPSLKVVPFKNATGSTSWRVSGTLPSGRVRENFSTQAEAEARRVELLDGLIVSVLERPVMTRLPEHVVRQAESAVLELPAGTSLGEAVRFFREHYRPLRIVRMRPANDLDEGWAGALYRDWLVTQRKAKPETADAIRDDFVGAFARHQKVETTADITTQRARAWIYEEGKADRTHRDRYDRLGGFLSWAVGQHHVQRNVVLEDLDRPVVKNQAPPAIFTFGQAHALLSSALTDPEGPDMLPFFACCCLSGLRPEEQPRVAWEDAWLEEDEPYIELNEAKGGRARRHVMLCDSLVRILRWCKEQGLALGFFSKRKFDRIRRAAGVYDLWQKDIQRHTYASWHYALHRDIGSLIATMGNSEDVLFQHYIRPMAKREAALFPGLFLDYRLQRRASSVGIRIDRLLKRPVEEVPAARLSYLRTWLAGEISRLERAASKAKGGAATQLRAERDRLAVQIALVKERMT